VGGLLLGIWIGSWAAEDNALTGVAYVAISTVLLGTVGMLIGGLFPKDTPPAGDAQSATAVLSNARMELRRRADD
jgi:hypothetical protein